MKKVVLIISLMVLVLLVVSCAPSVPEEEIVAAADKLSDQELDTAIQQAEAQEQSAVVGQPVRMEIKDFKVEVDPRVALKVMYKEKAGRLESRLRESEATVPTSDEGATRPSSDAVSVKRPTVVDPADPASVFDTFDWLSTKGYKIECENNNPSITSPGGGVIDPRASCSYGRCCSDPAIGGCANYVCCPGPLG